MLPAGCCAPLCVCPLSLAARLHPPLRACTRLCAPVVGGGRIPCSQAAWNAQRTQQTTIHLLKPPPPCLTTHRAPTAPTPRSHRAGATPLPWPPLTHLAAGWGVGDASLRRLAAAAPCLLSLRLGLGASISDAGLGELAGSCGHLTRLELHVCHVSGAGGCCRRAVASLQWGLWVQHQM